MIIIGDAKTELSKLPEKSVNCCVTSPPYFGLRDYGVDGQIGLEETPEDFTGKLVDVFREVKRVLADDGTLWLNIGDSYAGSGKGPAGNLGKTHNEREMTHTKSSALVPHGCEPKDLIGIPWRVAFALQADGWYLRQDIIWAKPNPMPESVRDRCTKAHEYIFLFSKSAKYYFDHEAIKEPAAYPNGPNSPESIKSPHGQGFTRKSNPEKEFTFRPRVEDTRKDLRTDTESRHRSKIPGGQSLEKSPSGLRSKRSVWTVSTKPYKGAHFATFPPDLIEPCILAGCPPGGLVLDPFGGSGTVGAVAKENDRDFILIELNPEYKPLIDDRLSRAHYQHSF